MTLAHASRVLPDVCLHEIVASQRQVSGVIPIVAVQQPEFLRRSNDRAKSLRCIAVFPFVFADSPVAGARNRYVRTVMPIRVVQVA